MSPRSIRRAAERRASKLVRKQNTASVTPLPTPLDEPLIQLDFMPEDSADAGPSPQLSERACSQARLFANRANAELSTGPKTAEGKAISSLNAVKTGLTGRTVLLPSDDAADYQRHIEEYETEFKPVGLRERELVQSLADTQWRLQRIPGLEMAIYAQGRVEFGDAFADHDSALRASCIELQTFFKYEKQLRNLQLQESRLQRRYQKESAELRQLRKERLEQAQAESAFAPAAHPAIKSASAAAEQPVGFEFSTAPETALPAAPTAETSLLPSAHSPQSRGARC